MILAAIFVAGTVIWYLWIRKVNATLRSATKKAVCENADALQICAHRGAAPEAGLMYPNLDTIQALWQFQVRCYDIDSLQTKDDALLVAHPSVLQAELGENASIVRSGIADATLAELRKIGVREDVVPLLSSVLEEFADLSQYYKEPTAVIPMMMIELKGLSLNEVALRKIVSMGKKLEIVQHIALYFPRANLSLAQFTRSLDSEVHIGLIVPDIVLDTSNEHVNSSQQMTQDEKSVFDVIAPSIKVDTNIFDEAKRNNMVIATWNLDSKDSMWKSIASGANFGTSNTPFKFRRFLKSVKEKCKHERASRHVREFMKFVA